MPQDRLLTFDQATSYSQALREITDYGLQPGKLCAPSESAEGTTYTMVWHPQGQEDTYAKTHQLYVYYTSTSLYFPNRLTLPPDVTGWHVVHAYEAVPSPALPPADSAAGDYLCPFVVGVLSPGTPGVWASSAGWLATSVRFASPLDTYDAALSAISDLGLGLDGPCSWSASLGQEQTFAATHTLTVQTGTLLTSTLWEQQLRRTSGVLSVAPPSEHEAC